MYLVSSNHCYKLFPHLKIDTSFCLIIALCVASIVLIKYFTIIPKLKKSKIFTYYSKKIKSIHKICRYCISFNKSLWKININSWHVITNSPSNLMELLQYFPVTQYLKVTNMLIFTDVTGPFLLNTCNFLINKQNNSIIFFSGKPNGLLCAMEDDVILIAYSHFDELDLKQQ